MSKAVWVVSVVGSAAIGLIAGIGVGVVETRDLVEQVDALETAATVHEDHEAVLDNWEAELAKREAAVEAREQAIEARETEQVR